MIFLYQLAQARPRNVVHFLVMDGWSQVLLQAWETKLELKELQQGY